MSTLVRLFTVLILTLGVVALAPSSAQARCHYGACGQWGGWGWGPWGPGVGWGQGNPYYYGPACRWVRVERWRNGHRVERRVWRCW